jgi:hypothetical protein
VSAFANCGRAVAHVRGNGRALGGDHGIGPDRAVDVFEAPLAQVSEMSPDLTPDMVVGRRRDADAAGLGDTLEPCRYIDAVTKNVMRLDNYVADIDADTEGNTSVFRLIGCCLMRVWNCTAARTASTALGNSPKNPSPVFFTMRPPCSEIAGVTLSARSAFSLACVASSSLCMSRE